MTVALVAFDLDGTLLRGPTVCQILARRLGQAARMDALEQLTDLAAIRLGREEMAGWYAGTPVDELCGWLDDLTLAPGVADAFTLLHAHGIATAIVSVTWEFAVAHLARRLGVTSYLSTRLSVAGIDHVWPDDKAAFLRSQAARLGISMDQVAAVGDSWGDVPMLRAAGVRYAVGPTMLDVPGMIHLPAADIADVSRYLIGRRNPTRGC